MQNILFGFFVAWMASWIWPGCVESARCRRRGCQECFILVPCDDALRRIDSDLHNDAVADDESVPVFSDREGN